MTPGSTNSGRSSALVLGIGNSLRGDDGVGPWIAERLSIELTGCPQVCIKSCQQLTPELAADLADVSLVIFVDAAVDLSPGTWRVEPLKRDASASSPISHSASPCCLLDTTEKLFGSRPRAELIGIGVADTGLREGLSTSVSAAAELIVLVLKRRFAVAEGHEQSGSLLPHH
jgi:hydrogenase maturation protease